MNTRWQIVCAWCGPAALACFFVGFATAGFFPPMRPDMPLEQLVRIYAENATAIRLGTFIMVFSSGLVTPFAAALWVHMRRIEGREAPVLSMTQFAAGTTGIMMFLTEAMFWSITAYRPERNPEITQTLNDIAWFFTVMPFCLIVVQALAVAGAVFTDNGKRPVFPRWVGYFNIWCAVLYIPGGTCTFFKMGPLAWNGLFAFWVPACVYFTWFTVMARQVTRAARAYREELAMSGTAEREVAR
ncbi:MAG TPA: hypothetical protein VGH89_15360 [Pseudonocardia sp.]|jgi:hypothetical protein